MAVVIKICGLNTLETLEVALEAGADMVGFVFFPKSPRHISLDQARNLGAAVQGRATKVALSVDADDNELASIIDGLAPDVLQLHGHETPDRVSAVQKRFGLPVMKALPVADMSDLEVVPLYEKVTDRLLFDAKPPKQALLPGGNGVSFDWTLLDGLSVHLPYMLSGGLTCDIVAKALAMTGAWGVDVSSGVETAPGRKDPILIREFIAAARSAATV
jgi:phosphoribosylanthranilate isomerase